jgi:AcrR family transcriptional regulator
MYVLPKDPRQRRTKESIFSAFTTLVAMKPVAHISVLELSERAGVSRKTFYQYYSDQFALLEAIQDDLFEGFKSMLGDVPANIFDVVPVLIKFADQHRQLFKAIYENRSKNNLIPRVMDYVYDAYYSEWLAANPTLDERDVHFLFNYVTSGLEGVVHNWLLNHPDISVDVMIEKTAWLMQLTTP